MPAINKSLANGCGEVGNLLNHALISSSVCKLPFTSKEAFAQTQRGADNISAN
jgi:hypothetical protein